ncbi:MAG: hypothetical protein ABIL09_15830, partial [Gemmatimonadota bacterium]
NAALRAWLGAMDADVAYLVLDLGTSRLRLQHGGALLRDCRVLAAALPPVPSSQVLVRGLRRYRRADPYSEPQPGPFDWEHYLVEAATPECALYFDGGVLIYAAEAWGQPRPPSVRLGAADLRALYDALPSGAPLVVLPAGWRGDASGGAPLAEEGGAR